MRLGGKRTPSQDSGDEAQLMTLDSAPEAPPDITKSSEYTLEEAKQKAEQDALLAEAEAKMMGGCCRLGTWAG